MVPCWADMSSSVVGLDVKAQVGGSSARSITDAACPFCIRAAQHTDRPDLTDQTVP